MRRVYRLSWICLVVLLCWVVIGCGSGSGGGDQTLRSGVQGLVTRGPIAPTIAPSNIPDEPMPGVVVVVQRQDGSEAARQITDLRGTYKIGVPSGNYQVVGLSPNGNSGPPTPPAPQPVTVEVDRYATVDLSYDTGIRF